MPPLQLVEGRAGALVNTKLLGRWRKLYTTEQGSFARLPWVARAAARELLVLVDDLGRIEVGDEDLADVVAFRMGADLSDRRIMRRVFPLLIADGYLVRDGAFWVVRNFVEAQGARDVSATRTRHELDTNSTRTRHELDTTGDLKPRNSSIQSARGEERREEQQQSAREAPAAPVCPTVETATATPPRAPGAVLFAALSAGAGDAVRTMVSGDALVRFTALCHELGVDAPALRVLGEYLRHDRAAHPDRFPWRSSRGPHTAVDLGFLTRQEGENLVEFVGKARDWHASRPSEDAVAASRAAQRAAVDAAADTRGALSREETVRRASEARAALAALAPASPARRESGERGAA